MTDGFPFIKEFLGSGARFDKQFTSAIFEVRVITAGFGKIARIPVSESMD